MMGKRFVLALAVLSTVGFATAATAESEADSAYRSFRIPRHHWFTWVVGFNGSGNSNSINVPGRANRDGRVSGNLNTAAAWFLDSDAFQRRLSVSVAAGGGRGHGERSETDSISIRTVEQAGRDASERLALDGSIRIYPRQVSLGLELSGFGEVNFTQSRQELDDARFELNRPVLQGNLRGEDDQSATNVGAFATLGLGRVRDATVVYRIQLLEQRLLATGNLKRALSAATRKNLAALFYVGPAFSVPHDRPEKFLWREIERILREDGALDPGSLDAYAVFRVIEPALEEKSLTRSVGFFIGPTASVYDQQWLQRSNRRSEFTATEGDSVVGRSESTLSDRRFYHDSFVSVGARAEYHRPMGMKWQVDAGSALQYVDRTDLLLIGSMGTVSYLIADRWFADVSVGHSWDRTGAGQPAERDAWALTYSGSLAYYIEDAWRLGISWNARETHDPDRVSRNAQFALGITYHIAGSLEVPGVVDPVRMLRQ